MTQAEFGLRARRAGAGRADISAAVRAVVAADDVGGAAVTALFAGIADAVPVAILLAGIADQRAVVTEGWNPVGVQVGRIQVIVVHTLHHTGIVEDLGDRRSIGNGAGESLRVVGAGIAGIRDQIIIAVHIPTIGRAGVTDPLESAHGIQYAGLYEGDVGARVHGSLLGDQPSQLNREDEGLHVSGADDPAEPATVNQRASGVARHVPLIPRSCGKHQDGAGGNHIP